jgi:chromatin remodeling complex protein RSC6
MRELVPKGAMEVGKLPIFLTTWVDKSSPLCMFTHAQLRAWSVPHLKSGCWYLDCAKGFCHEDEEDLKKSIDIASGIIDLTAAADVDDQQEDEKEKKKEETEKERARKKKQKKQEKATEIAAEKTKKSGRSSGKASSPEVEIPESSSVLPSILPQKCDASFAGLSA